VYKHNEIEHKRQNINIPNVSVKEKGKTVAEYTYTQDEDTTIQQTLESITKRPWTPEARRRSNCRRLSAQQLSYFHFIIRLIETMKT
jgi:hypothetical protein